MEWASVNYLITPSLKGESQHLKILLDEMYTGLKEYLQTLGWDVLTVQDVNLTGAKDKEIVEYAEKNKLLL